MKELTKGYWGVQWRSQNKRDGYTEGFMWENGRPVLFRTRAEAREWIKRTHNYIAHRPDLLAEPHGWKMPRPIRVTFTLRAAE